MPNTHRPTPHPLPVITGTIHLDLTRTPSDRRRAAAYELTTAPRGARVELCVGDLTPLCNPDLVAFLAEAADTARLTIDVHGSADVVGPWVWALRDALQLRRPMPRPRHLQAVPSHRPGPGAQ